MRYILILSLLLSTLVFQGCRRDEDYFEANKRIVVTNIITGDYIFDIKGRCSIYEWEDKLHITCKVGENLYKKYSVRLSNNITYFIKYPQVQMDD